MRQEGTCRQHRTYERTRRQGAPREVGGDDHTRRSRRTLRRLHRHRRPHQKRRKGVHPLSPLPRRREHRTAHWRLSGHRKHPRLCARCKRRHSGACAGAEGDRNKGAYPLIGHRACRLRRRSRVGFLGAQCRRRLRRRGQDRRREQALHRISS